MGLNIILGGLSLAAGVVQGIGKSNAEKYAAQQSERAAEVGRVQADQIDASYRDELNSTISNIRAIRASTGTGSNSPTGMAIAAKNEKVSDRNRSRDVASRRIQANQDENDARFHRSAAGTAFLTSTLGGVTKSLPYFFGGTK